MSSSWFLPAAALIVPCLVAACGGGDDGVAADGDAAPAPDAVVVCGPDLCNAAKGLCGVGLDGCGGAVDCGACAYADDAFGAGRWPSYVAGDVPQVAYVVHDGDWRVELAARGDAGWSVETVATLAGEPRGRPDLAVALDGTRWVAFVDDQGAIRVASAPAGAPFTVGEPLGSGTTVAISLDGRGTPVVALGGLVLTSSGVFVAFAQEGGGWAIEPIGEPSTGGAPRSVALDVAGDQIDVAWRDAAGAIRWARGRSQAYTVEQVDPSATPASDDGALDLVVGPHGRPHVLYGRGPGELVYAVRDGELWRSVVIASDHADRDDALTVDAVGTLHAAGFRDGGLGLYDGLAGGWLGTVEPVDCEQGSVDVDVDAYGAVGVVYACSDVLHLVERAGPAAR